MIMEYVGGDVDYNSGPYTVQFNVGVTSASLNISINDDDTYEKNETFTLTINVSSLPKSISVGANNSITVTIAANDGKYGVLCVFANHHFNCTISLV